MENVAERPFSNKIGTCIRPTAFSEGDRLATETVIFQNVVCMLLAYAEQHVSRGKGRATPTEETEHHKILWLARSKFEALIP